MRRFRRNQRDRPDRPDRPDAQGRLGRTWLVLLPGAVLALVVVGALVTPGFGVVVTGGHHPRPPDLGGPILLPTVVTTTVPPTPIPIAVPEPGVPEEARQRYARDLAAQGLTPDDELRIRRGEVPAVTYRPLPATVPSSSAVPAQNPILEAAPEPPSRKPSTPPAELPPAPAPAPTPSPPP